MASMRCSLCGIDYPAEIRFRECPVHKEATTYFQNEPVTDNWQWKATAILNRITTVEDGTGILGLPVPITRDADGFHWISSYDVIDAGVYHRLPPDTVFEKIDLAVSERRRKHHPSDTLWEVVGYHSEKRAYWVRPLRVPDHVPLAWDT